MAASMWQLRISKAEMRALDEWWKEYDAWRKSLPTWPPKWKPVRPGKRWKK